MPFCSLDHNSTVSSRVTSCALATVPSSGDDESFQKDPPGSIGRCDTLHLQTPSDNTAAAANSNSEAKGHEGIGVASMRQDEANASSWFSKAFFLPCKNCLRCEKSQQIFLAINCMYSKSKYREFADSDGWPGAGIFHYLIGPNNTAFNPELQGRVLT